MDRPRLLLVPQLTELEWVIRPQLEEWAEVASYDAPGVGDEPPIEGLERLTSEAVARRGIDEIARRGWDGCVVVADEFGVAAATNLLAVAPETVQAVAIGHARISNELEGERAPMNREVFAGLAALLRADTRTFIRQLFRLTGGETMKGGISEDLAGDYLARVPLELLLQCWDSRPEQGIQIGEQLRAAEVPLLLAQHKGCLLYTDEGFEDAVQALPHAQAVRLTEKPGTNPEFARVLEAFCREHVALAV